MLFSYCDNAVCKQTLKESFVGTDCEQGNDVSMSARKKDYALRKARERIEFELAKRSVDLTAEGPRNTMIAAFAVAATLPFADSANLFDMLTDVTNVPTVEAENRIYAMSCRRSCT